MCNSYCKAAESTFSWKHLKAKPDTVFFSPREASKSYSVNLKQHLSSKKWFAQPCTVKALIYDHSDFNDSFIILNYLLLGIQTNEC